MTTTRAEREQARENLQAAMSHPMRARIHRILTERTASPKEIAEVLDFDRKKIPNVSHHCKRLLELKCAELVDERPVRGAVEHFYRATTLHIVITEDWEELHPAVKTDLVCDFFQAGVDDFTSSVKAKMVGSSDRFHLTRTRLVLDDQAIDEVLEIQERARLEIEEAQAKAANRLSASGEQAKHFSSWLAGFEAPPVTAPSD